MTVENTRRFPAGLLLLLSAVVILGLGWWWLTASRRDALVVYCAHDLMFAEEVLRDFERETGIPIVIVGDTEATKSLGLVQRLIREKDHPVCDVFWNNQLLGTVELARQGVLEPYKGKHWDEMPEQFRDDEGLWTGFGGRLRVWIIRTDHALTLASELGPNFQPQASAIAEAMFGTTLSHYAVLWDCWGGEAVKAWHQRLEEAGVRFVAGNATVKDLVAEGVCSSGMTDTDDCFQALDAGAAVRMEPIRVGPPPLPVDDRLRRLAASDPAELLDAEDTAPTICIPNTVAIIRGTDRRAAAERFVDYMTSPEAELHMARSRSRQIPLGRGVDPAQMPEDVKPLVEWANESVDLKGLADARAECLAWLSEEFAP